MEIECVLFGLLREAVGEKKTIQTVEEGTTVIDLVKTLVLEYDGLQDAVLTDKGDLRNSLVVTVNKQHIHQLNGQLTALSDGDTVRISSSIQGG